MTEHLKTFTAGAWRDASGPRYATEYPADGSTVATLNAAPAHDVDEADLIAQCNNNVYGLAAGIWTRDYKTVWRLGSALQTGTVWVNTYKQFSSSTPFGGVKMSGTGREKGRLGILEYTSQKSYYWGMNNAPLAWSST